MGLPSHNEDGVGGMHLYMPWWLDNRKLDFPRGYHIEFGGGRDLPGFGFMGRIDRHPGASGPGYGSTLKDEYRRLYGASLYFAGRGEMVPNPNSYCEIDPSVVDKWGIPVLRFHWEWSDHERRQARHMRETFRSIIEHLGGSVFAEDPEDQVDEGLRTGGRIIHEAGVTRMGADARTSCLNDVCQAHEVKNLFVCDAGPFVSQADKNLTWTIMALAWRTCDAIVAKRRAMEI
jgi:choline dehydrogenase-like flavoprotein